MGKGIMKILDERSFEEVMADELVSALRVGVDRAEKSVAGAAAFDVDQALDQKYAWGKIIDHKNNDTRLLDRIYLDGEDRGVDELALIAIRACSVEIDIAKNLLEKLFEIQRRLLGVGYSSDMVNDFKGALECVGRINAWVGRIDFSIRASKIFCHERRISKISSDKGFKRNHGMALYKEKILDVLFECLDSEVMYSSVDDVVNHRNNQILFEDVNGLFGESGSGVQIVKIENLAEKLKVWAKSSKGIKDQIDRAKDLIESKNKKMRKEPRLE